MNILQSLSIKTGIADSNGWLSPEFNWMSWALSCLQLTRLHGDVELYTNTLGKEILIDALGLPYSKVHVVLDEVKPPHPQLWAYSKLIVYGMQKKPFMHIDGDVFLWERLTDSFLQAQIAIQNIEIDFNGYYSGIAEQISAAKFWIPNCIIKQQEIEKQLFAYNCGIIGGVDIPFFSTYTQTAFEFLDVNVKKIAQLETPDRLNVLFEQYLLYCLIKEKGVQPQSYYEQPVGPMNYKNHFFVNFLDVPYKTKFIHTLGTYKQNFDTCLMLAKRLRQDYPQYYYRILEQCNKAGIKTIIKDKLNISVQSTGFMFYRTKLNLIALDTITLENDINERDLPRIIETVEPINKKEELRKLYQYEKQIALCAFQNINEDLSIQQAVQNKLLEIAFSSEEMLLNSEFSANPNIEYIPVNTDYTKNWYLKNVPTSNKKYRIGLSPEALIGTLKEVFCDELDIRLLEILSFPKNIEEIKTALIESFDADEIAQNAEGFDFIVQSRLKYAIHNNLILCNLQNGGYLKAEEINDNNSVAQNITNQFLDRKVVK